VNWSQRDICQWFKASCLGTVGCIILYTIFGFIFVRLHAQIITSQMSLFMQYQMDPLIMPDSPYLSGFYHQLGSSIFFGCTLGVLIALIGMCFSIVPWINSRFSMKDTISAVLMAVVTLYVTYSKEQPFVSIIFALLSPAAFFIPWTVIIRRSYTREIHCKTWVLSAVILAAPFFLFIIPGSTTFEDLRDSMLVTPVLSHVSDFYYEHTLLAAHVIKPVASQEQKVIAVSKNIKNIGPMPHGSLWIRSSAPCTISFSSMVVADTEPGCKAAVVADNLPVNTKNRVIKRLSVAFDENKLMRQGIGIFLTKGPILIIPVLFILWFALGVSRIYGRSRVAAFIIYGIYIGLFASPLHALWLRCELVLSPEKISSYILSEHEPKRYIALKTFPERLSIGEIMRFTHDPSARIRLNAFILARDKKDIRFMDVISKAIYDPQMNVRTKACWALRNRKSKQALRLLEDVFRHDASWYVRGYAYRGIGRIRPVARVVEEVTTEDGA